MNGSYGVFTPIQNGRGIKRVELFSRDSDNNAYVESSTLRETAFYRAIQHDSFATCFSIKISSPVHVTIEMDCEECALDQWVAKTSYGERVKHFTRIFAYLAHGLRFIHAAGVLHGDIKPGNIVICRDGSAKWIDFGGAQFCHSGGYCRGMTTFEYVSPEDALNDIYGPTNDMWALGMVMLYYFVKEYPEPRKSAEECRKWFETHRGVRVPRRIMPEYVSKMIHSLLTYGHKERPTAGDIVNALDPNMQLAGRVTRRRVPCDSAATAYLSELRRRNYKITRLVTVCCESIQLMMTEPWHETILLDDIAYAAFGTTRARLRSVVRYTIRDILAVLDFNLWIF